MSSLLGCTFGNGSLEKGLVLLDASEAWILDPEDLVEDVLHCPVRSGRTGSDPNGERTIRKPLMCLLQEPVTLQRSVVAIAWRASLPSYSRQCVTCLRFDLDGKLQRESIFSLRKQMQKNLSSFVYTRKSL